MGIKFDKHPGVKKAARAIPIVLTFMLALHVVFIYIYIGAVWGIEKHFSELPVAILDNDNGFRNASLGSQLAGALANVKSPYEPDKSMFVWKVLTPHSQSEASLLDDVDLGKYWLAVYIPENFTMNLVYGLRGLRPYKNNTVDLIYDEGRQYTTIATSRTMLKSALTSINNVVAEKILGGALGFQINTTVADLSAVVTPIQVLDINPHPVHGIGQSFATYMGFFVLWLSCMLVINGIKESTLHLERPGSTFWTPSFLSFLRLTIGFIMAALLALILTGIVAGFGMQYYYGFAICWLFVWLVALSFTSIIAGNATSGKTWFYFLDS
eukprot:TRINITY_DN7852_c0_g1_i1.p1 TRINITY_DN7852_c0_g1~~TRINITY_DN7852_c0_g1_i1.p1  ORF type:complete len:325 (-),score=64.63 TRINITY_DN7852_c0_g1_i1:193-1167(-)